MADESLTKTTIKGTKWVTFKQVGMYAISFFLSIILARKLSPEDFGLTGMLSILTAIATIFINSGLTSAIIRTKDTTQEDYSTVFYFNIFVSTFFYLLFFFLAPLIADFYHEPRLVKLSRWITVVFLINSFGIVQTAQLTKKLDFKKIAICYLIGIFISAIVSAFMAFNDFGVYSLVGQAISQALVTNILLWSTSKWRPTSFFCIDSFKKLWAFGSKILLTNIISKIIDNIDNILIGKIFSSTQLGYFVRAKSSKNIPEQIGSSILSSISFAVLSKVNDNINDLKNVHLKFFSIGTYIFVPVIIGLISVADNFIIALYSDKWIPSIGMFQIILLAAIPFFINTLFNQTIMALGKSNLFLLLNSIQKLLTLISIPIGILFGIIPFIWSIVSINFIALFINFTIVGKLVGVNIITYIKKIIVPVILSCAMAVATYFVGYIKIESHLLLLTIQCISGIIIYILLSFIFRIEEFNHIYSNIVKPFFKGKLIK